MDVLSVLSVMERSSMSNKPTDNEKCKCGGEYEHDTSMFCNKCNMSKKEISKLATIKEKVEVWIRNCDVDGRGILFNFTDADARELREIFREAEHGKDS